MAKEMGKTKSYLSYKIGGEYYATNVKFVHNIIENTNITKVPKMPDYMLGIINLRGMALPVIDSRIRLGIADTGISSGTCILVMEIEINKQKIFIGLLVDAVAEVLEIEQDEVKEMPSLGSALNREFLSGIYHDQEKFILIMDVNRIFTDNEIKDIKQFGRELPEE